MPRNFAPGQRDDIQDRLIDIRTLFPGRRLFYERPNPANDLPRPGPITDNRSDSSDSCSDSAFISSSMARNNQNCLSMMSRPDVKS